MKPNAEVGNYAIPPGVTGKGEISAVCDRDAINCPAVE